MMKLRKVLLSSNLFRITALLTLIYSILLTNLISYKSTYKGNETTFICTINDYTIEGDKLSIEAKCKEKLNITYYIKTIEEKNYLISTIHFGTKIKIIGSLSIPSNNTIPNAFNYKNYLYRLRTYYLLNASKIEVLSQTNNIFIKLKNLSYKKVNNFTDPTYYHAFILGNTSMITQEVLKSYRTNGVSHLFALSGLHVTIFSGFIISILKKLKLKELPSYIITFIILILFSFITGMSPSILRATLLFLFLSINKLFNLNVRTLDILYLIFTLLILINPFIIYNLSFILSFTVAYFLILSSSLLKSNNYIISLFKVSLLSSIVSTPLTIYYFGYINILGFINNLFFVPYVSFIVFPLSLISFTLPILSKLFYITTSIMETISILINKLKLMIYFPHISLFIVVLYLIILTIYILKRKKVLILFLIIILLIMKYSIYINTNLDIYYLDVKQGDSSLIVTPNNKSILIDTGGKLTYKKELWQERITSSIAIDRTIPFMHSIGVNHLDYLILTHGDNDHLGETLNLINNFKVKEVIFNCGETSTLENKIIKELNKKNIPYRSCINNLTIDNIYFKFLNTSIYDNENDNSSVIYFNYNNYKFLYMADASTIIEKNILSLYNLPNITFLKVGHHGSNTSTSPLFIETINPKYSIISVGKNNTYGHPKSDVLETLKNTFIYRTDLDGTIEINIKKDSYTIKTYKP